MTAVPKPPNLALAPPASGACKQGSLLGQGPQLLRPCPRSKGRESSGAHPGGQVGASHGGQEPCRACVPLGLVRPWVAAPRAEYMQALGLLREGGWLGVEMGRQGPGPPSRLPEPVLVGELPLGTQPAGYCGTCSTDEQLEDQRAPPSGTPGSGPSTSAGQGGQPRPAPAEEGRARALLQAPFLCSSGEWKCDGTPLPPLAPALAGPRGCKDSLR